MDKKQKVSIEKLRSFEPISTLSDERLEELQGLIDLESLGVGVTVFREGDVDNQTIYLLKGEVQLKSVADSSLERVISSITDEAKYSLAESLPRQMTCTAMTLVEVLRIDNSVLDYMMTWDQLAVAEERADADPSKTAHVNNESKAGSNNEAGHSWIRRMRHIMSFKNMPPANIKTLLQNMETVPVVADQVIIQQGNPGDYYYVLTEGEAVVTRTVELATISEGASFGEEALLSGAKRNASVTMKTAGQLMRLAKEDFNDLLKEPLLDRVTPDEARERVAKGDVWLDVRHVTEFNHRHLVNAINIPLHELRMRIKELDKAKHYICYCGTGRRSSAAAFLLVQKGFHVLVLIGGVQKIPQDLIKS